MKKPIFFLFLLLIILVVVEFIFILFIKNKSVDKSTKNIFCLSLVLDNNTSYLEINIKDLNSFIRDLNIHSDYLCSQESPIFHQIYLVINDQEYSEYVSKYYKNKKTYISSKSEQQNRDYYIYIGVLKDNIPLDHNVIPTDFVGFAIINHVFFHLHKGMTDQEIKQEQKKLEDQGIFFNLQKTNYHIVKNIII